MGSRIEKVANLISEKRGAVAGDGFAVAVAAGVEMLKSVAAGNLEGAFYWAAVAGLIAPPLGSFNYNNNKSRTISNSSQG